MILRITSVLENFEYANCSSKRCEKVNFMIGGEEFRVGMRVDERCVT
jgi:hypothetical protein